MAEDQKNARATHKVDIAQLRHLGAARCAVKCIRLRSKVVLLRSEIQFARHLLSPKSSFIAGCCCR